MKVNCLMRGWHILPLMIFLICAACPSLAHGGGQLRCRDGSDRFGGTALGTAVNR